VDRRTRETAFGIIRPVGQLGAVAGEPPVSDGRDLIHGNLRRSLDC